MNQNWTSWVGLNDPEAEWLLQIQGATEDIGTGEDLTGVIERAAYFMEKRFDKQETRGESSRMDFFSDGASLIKHLQNNSVRRRE